MKGWPAKIWTWVDNGGNVPGHFFIAITKSLVKQCSRYDHGVQGHVQEPKAPQGLDQGERDPVGSVSSYCSLISVSYIHSLLMMAYEIWFYS